jgi:hypothetical protein
MPQADPAHPPERGRRGRRTSKSYAFLDPPRPGGKRKRKRDLDDGGVPVEPNRPRNLEGGAAAALEFDD